MRSYNVGNAQSAQMNIFIIGLGKVGASFLKKIFQQKNSLQKTLKLDIRIIGLANSRHMHFNEFGIEFNEWEKKFSESEIMNVEKFLEKIEKLDLCNSFIIDNTASEEIAMTYEKILKKGIGIITCNKIACSSTYEYYKKLKTVSTNLGVPFFFETNVGAGLPIIDTLNSLINSGDDIHSIEAVLSGSLNFILNKFSEGTHFYESVKEAQKLGFTEPDPRIDLSGKDVMRKILILARECGEKLELEDIFKKSFIPEFCLKSTSIEVFYERLVDLESSFFEKIRISTKKNNRRLRFVARYKKGIASVGLETINLGHPFYQLDGKDNIISFTTRQYIDHPLTIKGAGAGSEVTASGIFSDVIKASSRSIKWKK